MQEQLLPFIVVRSLERQDDIGYRYKQMQKYVRQLTVTPAEGPRGPVRMLLYVRWHFGLLQNSIVTVSLSILQYPHNIKTGGPMLLSASFQDFSMKLVCVALCWIYS